jgi:hypothetical protein
VKYLRADDVQVGKNDGELWASGHVIAIHRAEAFFLFLSHCRFLSHRGFYCAARISDVPDQLTEISNPIIKRTTCSTYPSVYSIYIPCVQLSKHLLLDIQPFSVGWPLAISASVCVSDSIKNPAGCSLIPSGDTASLDKVPKGHPYLDNLHLQGNTSPPVFGSRSP